MYTDCLYSQIRVWGYCTDGVRNKIVQAALVGAIQVAPFVNWDKNSQWQELSLGIIKHAYRFQTKCSTFSNNFLDMDGEQAMVDICLSVCTLASVYNSLQLVDFVQPDVRETVETDGQCAQVTAAFLNELLGDQVVSERCNVLSVVREMAGDAFFSYLCVVGMSRYAAISLVALSSLAPPMYQEDRNARAGDGMLRISHDPLLLMKPNAYAFSTTKLIELLYRLYSWGNPVTVDLHGCDDTLTAMDHDSLSEKRVALNGCKYTKIEFMQLFGKRWVFFWFLGNVRRIAWDGMPYGVHQFMDYYGEHWRCPWENAKREGIWV